MVIRTVHVRITCKLFVIRRGRPSHRVYATGSDFYKPIYVEIENPPPPYSRSYSEFGFVTQAEPCKFSQQIISLTKRFWVSSFPLLAHDLCADPGVAMCGTSGRAGSFVRNAQFVLYLLLYRCGCPTPSDVQRVKIIGENKTIFFATEKNDCGCFKRRDKRMYECVVRRPYRSRYKLLSICLLRFVNKHVRLR